MASVMSWPTRRWLTFHDPEESDNIVAGRNAHLADVARRYPHVQDWGRDADPSKGLPLYGIRGDECDCGGPPPSAGRHLGVGAAARS
jgi:hypothetical protein